MESNNTPLCADCGDPITDGQDIEYRVLNQASGGFATFHSDEYHREIVGDDDSGPSPYAYYEQQYGERDRAMVAQAQECIAVGTSGNECRMPAAHVITFDDGHRIYVCETHRNPVLRGIEDDYSIRRIEEPEETAPTAPGTYATTDGQHVLTVLPDGTGHYASVGNHRPTAVSAEQVTGLIDRLPFVYGRNV